jgi:hypothetical protein
MLPADRSLPLERLEAARQRRRPARRLRLSTGWPLWASLVLYPVWWALGLGAFSCVIFAIPMAWTLLKRRPLRYPPAFGIWLAYLVWTLVCLVMLPVHAPHTTEGSFTGRSISLVQHIVQLSSATVFLLYLVNMTQKELPQRRVLKWMGVLFLVTIAGGLLALADPHFQFNAPLEYVLPHGITKNVYVHTLVHPAAAQVQNVLGFSAPRPAAPWAYTNLWGNNLSILLVWFCIYMWDPKTVKRHFRLLLVIAVALVPIIYSLNRGLWFGLMISIVFLIFQLAKRGDLRATFYAIAAIGVGAVLFLATPLSNVVTQRASHGQSNDIRKFIDTQSFKGALESPLLGWGDSRKVIGSSQSIAVGPSPECPLCGAVNLGSTGEIWVVMFDQGLFGALLYLGFFAAVWWRLRSNRTLVGAGGRLILILSMFYTFFYNNLPTGLILTMLSIGVATRGPTPDRPTLPAAAGERALASA